MELAIAPSAEDDFDRHIGEWMDIRTTEKSRKTEVFGVHIVLYLSATLRDPGIASMTLAGRFDANLHKDDARIVPNPHLAILPRGI